LGQAKKEGGEIFTEKKRVEERLRSSHKKRGNPPNAKGKGGVRGVGSPLGGKKLAGEQIDTVRGEKGAPREKSNHFSGKKEKLLKGRASKLKRKKRGFDGRGK